MTKDRALDVIAILLNSGKADEMFISMNVADTVSLQFANNTILRSMSIESVSIQVTVRVGQQYGVASGNVLDEDKLRGIVRSAESQIGRLPKRDEVIPFQGETKIASAPLVTSKEVTDAWRFEQIGSAIEDAAKVDLRASGILNTSKNQTILASSNGLFLYQSSTPSHILFRVMDQNGASTGFRESRSYNTALLDVKGVAQNAIDKCIAWKNPKDIKADRIPALFEPQAFSEMLVPYLQQFDLTAFKQKRSFLNKLDGTSRIGDQMYDSWVNIFSDPYHPEIPSMPFSAEGVPITAKSWVKDGVIESLSVSRFEALAEKKEPVPFPTNFIMRGGEDTLNEMIARVQRGLLITGLTGLTIEDPSNCLLTGSTRNGLFLIEDGKISSAVSNLVIRETPIYLLKRKDGLGIPEITSPQSSYLPMLVPPILSKDVMFIRQSGIV